MKKFNWFLLTVTLSLFSLLLFKTEGAVVHKKVTHTPDIKIDGSYNTSALIVNSSFNERLGFDTQKLPSAHLIYPFIHLKNAFLEDGVNYLKVCSLIDLNLTTRTIIFPFHSFL